MSVRCRWLGLAPAGLVMLAACQQTPPAPVGSAPTPGTAVAAREAVAEAPLQVVSFADWQQVLAAQGDRLVVVELWATWCLPCMERFGHTVELSRQWGPRGVVFLSMSLDDFADPDSLTTARRFLAGQGATFPHYLLAEPIPRAFEHLDLLGIPAVFFYRQGKLIRRLTSDDPNHQYTDNDVDAAVAELASG